MAKRTITVKGDGQAVEKVANAAITPGHLVELMSTDKLRVHATAGGNAQRMFAIENELIGAEIATAYAATAQCLARVFKNGDQVAAILADGENAAIGSMLESNGNGELKVHTASSAGAVEYPEAIVGIAIEAVNASDSATTPVASRRIFVEII